MLKKNSNFLLFIIIIKNMVCPNYNKNMIENFHKLGLIDRNLSPEEEAIQRRRLYYTVCITFRLFLAGLLFQLKDKKWIQILVAVLSGFAIINYLFLKKDNEWWNIYFSLFIYISLFISSILIILGFKITTYSLPFLFFFSIFSGIFKSMTRPSC